MKLLLLFIILLFGCSGLEQSEQEKTRKLNISKQRIYRKADEQLYSFEVPEVQKRGAYPWEHGYVGQYPKITKEFFRCKGSGFNPERIVPSSNGEAVHHFDCGGSDHHSLPMVKGKEFVYPILTDLLNYLQVKTSKKVIVTCGHRCPVHNTYVDSSPSAQVSKHMIGAEVDFYVQGMELQPEEIVKLLIQYYHGNKEYESFVRYHEAKDVAIAPWYNKEITIKLFQKNEGRDLDNQHNHPYLCIQVRYDRERKEKVAFSHEKASKGYQRF